MRSLFRRSRGAAVLGLAAATLASCSDSPGGSDAPVVIQISASTGPPTYTSVPGDPRPHLLCELVLRATATGEPNKSAVWSAANFRLFSGPNRETAVDSFTVSTEEIQQSWGSPSIAVGSTQEARWEITTPIPATVVAEVAYTVPGTGKYYTARYEVSCPPSTGANTPPTVSNVQVTPASGEVEPGQQLTLSYSLSAPAGLWETTIVLTGAVEKEYTTREQFQTSGQRTLNIPVPGGAKLGQPLMVAVRVTDTHLRVVTATAPGSVTVVDRTPPQLERVATRAPFNPRANDMVGQYAPGDTIIALLYGSDNNGVAWVGWGVDAPGASLRDSLPANDPRAAPLHIPVRPEWVGGARLSVWLKDHAGLRSEMASLPDSIRVYPVVNRPTRTAQTPGGNADAVVDPARRLLYVAMPDRKEIAVLSLATMTFGTPIAVPGIPRSLDLTVSGDSLVVALPHANELAVVNLRAAAGTAVPVVSTGSFTPNAVRIAADGRVLVSTRGALGAVNLGTGAVTTLATESGAWAESLERTPDRSKVVYGGACRLEYAAAARTVAPCRPFEGVGHFGMDDAGRVFSRGPWLYRAGATQPHLFANELALTSTSAPSPDGTEVYLSSVRGLLRASVDGRILDRMPFPHVYGQILFADGGNTLLAVSYGSPGTQGTHVIAVDLH
ncbi:MAG TPA: hypothetical protein VFS20_28490 [Longimicrobium sp.]|nr:hypothetical protein [Longimicrobium sp.]